MKSTLSKDVYAKGGGPSDAALKPPLRLEADPEFVRLVQPRQKGGRNSSA